MRERSTCAQTVQTDRFREEPRAIFQVFRTHRFAKIGSDLIIKFFKKSRSRATLSFHFYIFRDPPAAAPLQSVKNYDFRSSLTKSAQCAEPGQTDRSREEPRAVFQVFRTHRFAKIGSHLIITFFKKSRSLPISARTFLELFEESCTSIEPRASQTAQNLTDLGIYIDRPPCFGEVPSVEFLVSNKGRWCSICSNF